MTTPITPKGDRAPAEADAPGTEPPVPVLRRDAARNRTKILAAAQAAFNEDGIDVGVEVIAQRAGVGVGTLYRRFPTKEHLIDAVVDELLGSVLSAAESALEDQSPANGVAEYLRAVGLLQFENSGCLARLWRDSDNEKRGQIEQVSRKLLAQAQQVGAVRSDVVYEDVIMLLWSQRGVIEATLSVSPDAWLRYLDLMLCALAPGQAPLAHPPLTAKQAQAAKRAGTQRHPISRASAPTG